MYTYINHELLKKKKATTKMQENIAERWKAPPLTSWRGRLVGEV